MKLNLKKIRFAANKKLEAKREIEIPCDKCIVRACCTQRCPAINDFLIDNRVIDITSLGDNCKVYLFRDRKIKVPFAEFDVGPTSILMYGQTRTEIYN